MPFHKVVISGVNGVPDIIQFGFAVSAAPLSTPQQTADAVKSAWDSQWSVTQPAGMAFRQLFHSSTKFQKITVYERPLDPTLPATDVAEAIPTNQNPIATSQVFPPEVAECITLHTGHPGKKWRGRMYLPAVSGQTVGTGGTMGSQVGDSIAQWAAAFFGDINDGVKFVCVWSRVDQALRHVTDVAVGQQFDMQRRRQNAAPETYTTVSVSQI
jgi:hypothetical protein